MSSTLKAFAGAALAAATLAGASASAHVATISGAYDYPVYDTPSLTFNNTSAFNFTGITLKLTGYQGLNNGIVQSITLPDITAGSSFTYVWLGATTGGTLFAYDYDDEYGVYPAQVGNFAVTFTATWNSQSIYSQFTPAVNASGGFVGWEGLDPAGYAESAYDLHSGTFPGVLAYIDVGTPPPLPEPSTWALMLVGFAGLGGALRMAGRKAAAAA